MTSRLIKIPILLFLALNMSTSQEDTMLIQSITTTEYSFQRSGDLTRKQALNEMISFIQHYDAQKRLIRSDQINPDTKGIYKSYRYSEFIKRMAARTEIYNDKDEMIEYGIRSLNPDTTVHEIYHYTHSGQVLAIHKYFYNDNKNVATEIDSSFRFNRTLKWEYKYNDKDEIIEMISYNKEGEIRDTRTYIYDSIGNEIESTLVRANGEFTLFKSRYNDRQDMIENIWYDEEGQLKHETKFEYVYDDYGNWITKKRSSDGVINYVWEREIVYYNRIARP